MARSLNESLWRTLTEEIMSGMREWRSQHPTATLRAIETELDTRLHHMRARMLEDLALQSTAAAWKDASHRHTPTCPQCGTALDDRGQRSRTLLTQGGHAVSLERSYGVCPACGTGLFPPR
ncbi:MAG: hypothetical protein PVSMB4_18750 [Ktedonobacterales bacterium]